MYKYRILEFINKLPLCEAYKMKKKLPSLLNISPRTFGDWLYIKKDSSRCINSDALRIIANELKTTIEQLHGDIGKTNPAPLFEDITN